MNLVDEVKRLSATGEVGVDVITLAKRADGYTDLQIAEAYAEIYHSGEYEFRVDKGMGYFVPKENL